jgi:hypothetical protein
MSIFVFMLGHIRHYDVERDAKLREQFTAPRRGGSKDEARWNRVESHRGQDSQRRARRNAQKRV